MCVCCPNQSEKQKRDSYEIATKLHRNREYKKKFSGSPTQELKNFQVAKKFFTTQIHYSTNIKGKFFSQSPDTAEN